VSKEILDGLGEIEEALARHGVPKRSDWWRGEERRFYGHPSAREWLACVGRGGVKTGEIVRTAIAESLFGEHFVPPGERHFFMIVSENVAEATKTADIVQQYLQFLGVESARVGETIEIGRDRGIRVRAQRIGAVSGFRCYGWAADECAKWSSESGVNPSAEVIASIKAMTITHARARGRMFSAPFSMSGFFHGVFSDGDSRHVVVSHAPTWVANPTIPEARTRELERDERIWKREYKAEPSASASAAFDPTLIERAFVTRVQLPACTRVIVMDPSELKNDDWTWCSAGWRVGEGGRSYISIEDVDCVEAGYWRKFTSADVCAKVAKLAKERGITAVHGDQKDQYSFPSLFAAHGLSFTSHPWKLTTKAPAVARLRGLLADGEIAFEKHAKLQRQLIDYEEVLSANGHIKYKGRGSSHDDFASVVITSVMCEQAGNLPKYVAASGGAQVIEAPEGSWSGLGRDDGFSIAGNGAGGRTWGR